ncbi:hypothetical protein TWF970_000047 [Orbilia oligospora]|uniref:F-box domain-containing protein n=1 Tax=Orbilia oligospora TaxID=2813651 RepID=A0A7C8VH33_ORBOL|nr:hypothetical protein TWF970_000047 [Orbilia oligospora]
MDISTQESLTMGPSTIHDQFMIPTRTSPATIGDLPIELHQQVLSYLPWRDQLNCEHVCKAWREDLRGRVSKPRSIVAPWLPQQDFDLALYGALVVHTLVTNGTTFAFKCTEGYKLYPSEEIVSESIFQELGGALEGENFEAVQCISEFNFIEKAGTGANIRFEKYPLANLSFLNDMLVNPAFVDEDEIRKLYVRFVLQELAPPVEENKEGEASIPSDQTATDSDDDGDNDSDSDDDEDPNGPVYTTLSSGQFTTDVNLNPDGCSTDIFYRLTLGTLLFRMRENLLRDIIRVKGLDPDNPTYPEDLGAQEIVQLDNERAIKKREYEAGTVIIQELQFERCRENQALSISFSGMIVSEESLKPWAAEFGTEASSSSQN